jgi:hypothetical protein
MPWIPARAAALAAALAVAVAGCGGGGGSSAASTSSSEASPTTGRTDDGLVDIGAGLRGPGGLVATRLLTAPVDVAALAEHAAGRLWLATAAYEDDGTDAVWVVPSDGAAPVEVIPGLPTPPGLLWGDSVYVAVTGAVERYTGFDRTGRCSSATGRPARSIESPRRRPRRARSR